jgi:vacuolar-type H+-ATPase subunit E/Vma4
VTHAALIEAVQQQTAAAIAALWVEVRAEADRARGDADRTLEQQRAQHARNLREVSDRAIRAANTDAARRARAIRAAAKAAMADRLLALAEASLTGLRGDSCEQWFARLASELPDRKWARLAVHPDDAALARAQFPVSSVHTDVAIAGGLIAADDELSVDNTLDRRLAAAWPELLPAVMTDVLLLLDRSRAAA